MGKGGMQRRKTPAQAKEIDEHSKIEEQSKTSDEENASKVGTCNFLLSITEALQMSNHNKCIGETLITHITHVRNMRKKKYL